MTRAEAIGWQVGCTLGAAAGVVIVELFSDHIEAWAARARAAWRVWRAI